MSPDPSTIDGPGVKKNHRQLPLLALGEVLLK
jgi:hypothetical protein